MSQLHLYVLRHAIYNEPLANNSEMLKIYYNVVKHVRQIFLVRVSNGCPLFTYYISFSNVVSQGFRTAITSQIYILFHTSILCVHSIELFEIKENTGDRSFIVDAIRLFLVLTLLSAHCFCGRTIGMPIFSFCSVIDSACWTGRISLKYFSNHSYFWIEMSFFTWINLFHLKTRTKIMTSVFNNRSNIVIAF